MRGSLPDDIVAYELDAAKEEALLLALALALAVALTVAVAVALAHTRGLYTCLV